MGSNPQLVLNLGVVEKGSGCVLPPSYATPKQAIQVSNRTEHRIKSDGQFQVRSPSLPQQQKDLLQPTSADASLCSGFVRASYLLSRHPL